MLVEAQDFVRDEGTVWLVRGVTLDQAREVVFAVEHRIAGWLVESWAYNEPTLLDVEGWQVLSVKEAE